MKLLLTRRGLIMEQEINADMEFNKTNTKKK